MIIKFLSCLVICLLLVSCDSGLAPPPPIELGFSGRIYFSGSWPTDSLVNLWIFASQIYPLDSAKVVAGLFQNPHTIFLYPGINQSLPFNTDTISYSFPLRSGTYKYVGVIRQTSQDITTYGVRIFRVVGFYKDSTDISKPGIVEVNDHEQIRGININVDFHNPPPQPF